MVPSSNHGDDPNEPVQANGSFQNDAIGSQNLGQTFQSIKTVKMYSELEGVMETNQE